MEKVAYEPDCFAAIGLLLRRTLVRLVMLFHKNQIQVALNFITSNAIHSTCHLHTKGVFNYSWIRHIFRIFKYANDYPCFSFLFYYLFAKSPDRYGFRCTQLRSATPGYHFIRI
jgi:hypothetical protein